MEENKFEKEVQQKMDELKIQPSESVWEKIEVRIEKRKSRRRGLIILFLFASLILLGSYWLWNSIQQRFISNHTLTKNISLNNTDHTSSKENENVQSKKKFVPVEQNKNQIKEVQRKNNSDKNITERYKLLNNSKVNQKKNVKRKTGIAFFKENRMITKVEEKTESEIISGKSSQEQIENYKNKKVKDIIDKKTNADSLTKSLTKNIPMKNNDTSGQKQADTAIIKQSKKNKWKLGLVFSGGISRVGNNFLALNNSLPAAFSTSSNQGLPPTLQLSPSLIKSGFGFITGVIAEKNITKKAKFIMGINFKFLNTSNKLNDSGPIYSSMSATKKYINHFSFIEVPFSVQIEIGKGKNVPLFWQGGLAVSQLIYSNALQFNSYTGYYYKDNSILNKTQVGFNTSILMSLFSKQKTSILIGPNFYYDASKIASNGLYSKKHFVFAGLHTEIIFDK